MKDLRRKTTVTYQLKVFSIFALICIGSTLAFCAKVTSAKQGETSVLVNKPSTVDEGPALPPPTKPSADAPTADQPAARSSNRPFMRPAEPREPARGKLTGNSEPMPAPARAERHVVEKPLEDSGPVVHPAPPIDYDTHRSARRMYRSGQIQLVVVAQDPADGCCYEIPLCIPACCNDAPKVSGGRGIFGRGVVEYCWSCGFRAKVKFRHVLGDVKVEYEGD